MIIRKLSYRTTARLMSIAVGCCLILSVFTGCSSNDNQVATFYAMGGIPVRIITSDVSPEWLSEATETTRAQVETWEAELSLYRPDSAVNKVCNSYEQPVQFSESAWEAITIAKEIQETTHGAFDITVGPLIKLWKEAEKFGQIPTVPDIQVALSVTGFEYLDLDHENRTIQIGLTGPVPDYGNIPEVLLDVGGLAKGLFAQWISESLLEQAAESGETPGKMLVDLGGDMYVNCQASDNPCTVGIRDPFSTDRSKLWGIISVSRGAVVTSGTYERHFLVNNRRFCHIVDPGTGYPIETDLVSVTVQCDSGGKADALATAMFVMGEKAGQELAATTDDLEIVLIHNDGSYYASDGIKGNLDIL